MVIRCFLFLCIYLYISKIYGYFNSFARSKKKKILIQQVKLLKEGKRDRREWRNGICTSRTTRRKSKTGRNVVID